MSELHPIDLRNLVRLLRRRGYGWPTIVRRVHDRFPQVTLTEAEARSIWAAFRPKDLRPGVERRNVTISLGGPAWSHPKRSAG